VLKPARADYRPIRTASTYTRQHNSVIRGQKIPPMLRERLELAIRILERSKTTRALRLGGHTLGGHLFHPTNKAIKPRKQVIVTLGITNKKVPSDWHVSRYNNVRSLHKADSWAILMADSGDHVVTKAHIVFDQTKTGSNTADGLSTVTTNCSRI
jgi:hypothetical protein